ncbi:MAG: glutamate synthase subunit beta [Solirubrobacteraceae bacterium]
MGKISGFMEYERQVEKKLPVNERIENFKEFLIPMEESEVKNQGARCMNCGIPFCHSGCPLGNLIPDFNDAVYKEDWQSALKLLLSTNNFPEFTGRLCPAPCETACVLGINEDPVAIENIEKNIIEIGYKNNWIKPIIPEIRTGKKVAVIGSGPAGMAAADQLNKAGHTVTLFERDPKIGGLLRYGIPDFKLEKSIIDRKVNIMEQEGIQFKVNTSVGKDINGETLEKEFDAIVLTGGSTIGRRLSIPGSDLKGVHLAMEFLKQQNLENDSLAINQEKISATGKNVIVIGGGDTGSDCVGTSLRNKAKTVNNFEISIEPTSTRPENQPWPYYPTIMRVSSSHEEGVTRTFKTNTKEFIGDKEGNLKALITIEIQQKEDPKTGRINFVEVEGSEKEWPCELALLALGFVSPESDGIVNQLGLELDQRNNVKASILDYKTNNLKVFAAGDMRRGQSLIVWAISEGREAAYHVDKYLMGHSDLPTKGGLDIPRA